MRPGGFEPPTNSLEGCCSIHLSYGRATVLQQVTRGTARRPANGVTNCAKRNAPLPRCAGSRIEESSRAARVYVLSKFISRPELEPPPRRDPARSEEHTSELQSLAYLVCRLLLEKKKKNKKE